MVSQSLFFNEIADQPAGVFLLTDKFTQFQSPVAGCQVKLVKHQSFGPELSALQRIFGLLPTGITAFRAMCERREAVVIVQPAQ